MQYLNDVVDSKREEIYMLIQMFLFRNENAYLLSFVLLLFCSFRSWEYLSVVTKPVQIVSFSISISTVDMDSFLINLLNGLTMGMTLRHDLIPAIQIHVHFIKLRWFSFHSIPISHKMHHNM